MIGIIVIILLSFIISKCFSRISSEDPILKRGLFILLWLIIGLRHNVGIDYPVYEEMYNDPNSVHNLATEPFWHYLNDILRGIGFRSRMFFLVTSGYTMFCFYKGIDKLSPDFYLSTFLFVLINFYFESANTVRQCCALGSLLWATAYLSEKAWCRMTILFILAVCMHLSAVFGIILIAVSNIRIKPGVEFALLTLCILFGSQLMDFAVSTFIPVMADIGKYNYDVDRFDDGISSGILKYVYYFTCVLLIFSSNLIEKRSTIAYKFINLTVYGVCLYSVFYTFQPARRLFMYGFVFSIIALPYFFSIFKNYSKYITTGFVCFVYLLFLIKSNLYVPYSFDFLII